jgi:hypothetical protein
MEPGTARQTVGANGNHQDGAPAVPAAGSRRRAGMFALTAAAVLALAFAAATGTPAAPATAAITARTAATMDAQPEFDPCPCDNPVCRPLCFQSMTSGGPASMIYPHTHPAAECTDPKCISGTPPAVAPRPDSQLTGRPSHRRPPARAAGRPDTSPSAVPAHTGTSTAVNCPPQISDPGKGGC